jgi:transcriptional regulator with XRE-family HTH domain
MQNSNTASMHGVYCPDTFFEGGGSMVGRRHRLASIRKAAGFSQERLAEAVGVERTTVMRWERGETRPQPWARPKLARALGITDQALPELLGESAEPENAASAPGPIADKVVTMSDWNVASESLSIATIRAMSESFQVANRKLGGGLLYHSVLRYIKLEIAPSLLDPPRDCLSSELFSAAASLTEVAGWMAHDGGNDDKSQRHFNQAYHLAVAAENPVLSANVCASLSHLAVQHGQAEDAARIAAAGLARVTRIEGTEQLVARLYAMCARAAAMQNLAKECHLALGAARDALCSCGGSTRAGWIAAFDEASLAGESAHCFYSLGALAEAENQARKVIEFRRIGDRV